MDRNAHPSTGVPIALVGISASVHALRDDVGHAASMNVNVLITGPRGIGKESLARFIHAQSPQRDQSFRAVDCAQCSESDLTTDLAFGGALYLKNVDQLTSHSQKAILGLQAIWNSIRVIAGTDRDLTADRGFSPTLFYRLNIIHLVVPPLRERREDVPILLRDFLASAEPLEPAIQRRLMAYEWAGDFEQLKMVAEALSNDPRLEAAELDRLLDRLLEA